MFAVPFMNTPVDNLKLIDIKGKFSGTFNLKGCIRWLKEPVQTTSGMLVCDAMLADNTFNVPISVWGDTISEIQEENYYKLLQTITVEIYAPDNLYLVFKTVEFSIQPGYYEKVQDVIDPLYKMMILLKGSL